MILISGAGPAGLSAAIMIAKAGGSAVVSECRTDVGSRLRGDFQGIENWTTRQDALDELATIGIEPRLDTSPFREIVLYDPQGREYQYRSQSPLFYLATTSPAAR